MTTFVIAKPEAALNRYTFFAGFKFSGFGLKTNFVPADHENDCLLAAVYKSRAAAQAAIDQAKSDGADVADWLALPSERAWLPIELPLVTEARRRFEARASDEKFVVFYRTNAELDQFLSAVPMNHTFEIRKGAEAVDRYNEVSGAILVSAVCRAHGWRVPRGTVLFLCEVSEYEAKQCKARVR